MRCFVHICCLCAFILMAPSVAYGLSEVVDEAPVILPPEVKYPEMIIRKDTHPNGRVTLSTPLASYSNNEGVVIYLVGAIHIGEKEYYAELNKRFSSYDVVLLEMVGGGGFAKATSFW